MAELDPSVPPAPAPAGAVPPPAAGLDATRPGQAADGTGPGTETGTGTGTGTGTRTGTGTGAATGTGTRGTAGTAARPAAVPEAFWPKILRAAWMAILLGFAIELLLLVGAVALGAYPGPRPLFADLAQKVTWSVLVCVGIAFGTAASKARPSVMGLLGLAAAPAAFQVAKSVHKGMTQALAVTGGGLPLASVALIAVLESLEYGALGWGVGWVGRRQGGLTAHAGAGLAIGLTFGVGLALLTAQTATGLAPAPELLAKGINEVLFPVGCALVLYAAEALGKRAA